MTANAWLLLGTEAPFMTPGICSHAICACFALTAYLALFVHAARTAWSLYNRTAKGQEFTQPEGTPNAMYAAHCTHAMPVVL